MVTVLGILCFSHQIHSPLCFDPETGFSGLLEPGFLAVRLLVRVSQYETSPGDWGVRGKSLDSSLTTTVYIR